VTVYYNPEAFGATIVGDVDTIGGYEYNMIAVFRRDADGVMFWGETAGCSCNSPFDEVGKLEDLTRIDDPAVFAADARKWLRDSYGVSADDRDGVEKMIRKVRDGFRKGLRK
jgi:hypothetical protein